MRKGLLATDTQRHSLKLKVAQNSFFNTSTLTDHFYKSLLVHTTILVSNRCPITGEQDMMFFLTVQVTITTVEPVKNTLNFGFKCFNSNTSPVSPIFFFKFLPKVASRRGDQNIIIENNDYKY